MLDLRKVLLASDLGENSARAMDFAVAIAAKFNAELHLVHVLEELPNSTPNFGGGLALMSYSHESPIVAEQELRSMIEPAWPQRDRLVVATAVGSPAEQIVLYAKEQAIDLIVIGTHGRTGLSHILLGSVAELVVRHAKCAVVTVASRK